MLSVGLFGVGLGWLGVGLFRVRLGRVGAKGEVSTAAAQASGRPSSVMLATPPSASCDMRSPASSEQRVRPTGLLCGRLLVALSSRAFCGPAGGRTCVV